MGNFKAGCDIFLTVCLLQERFLNRKISFLVYGNWEELQCVTLERQAHVKQPSFTQVQQHKHEKQHQTLSFSCQSGSARAMWSVFWICLNMSWPRVGRTYLTLCSTSKTQGCFFSVLLKHCKSVWVSGAMSRPAIDRSDICVCRCIWNGRTERVLVVVTTISVTLWGRECVCASLH